ncbi:hypothetical protein INR49_010154 [Caranx melampygus]|nr:hypothetical protein INR49_010154 [Caranx melampygus]
MRFQERKSQRKDQDALHIKRNRLFCYFQGHGTRKGSGYLQCNKETSRLVSGAGLVRVDHDVGQSVASFPPGAQVSSVSLDLVEPLLGTRFVRGAENKRLPSDVKHLKSVLALRICGNHTVPQADGLSQHRELPAAFVLDENQHSVTDALSADALHVISTGPQVVALSWGVTRPLCPHHEQTLNVLELQGLAALLHPLTIRRLGQLERSLHHEPGVLSRPSHRLHRHLSHLDVDHLPVLAAVPAERSEGPGDAVALLLGLHVDVLQVGLHATLGLTETCIVGVTFGSDLDDAAQQKWVFGHALEGRHEEGAQVHASQRRVVVLGDVQEDSEKRNRK